MNEEVFIYTESILNKEKIETIIAGHLRNGWKIEGMTTTGVALSNMTIVFSRILVEEEQS